MILIDYIPNLVVSDYITPTGHAGLTTCSAETARLGGNQTVVAFTFYGDDTYDTFNRDYFSGIKVRFF